MSYSGTGVLLGASAGQLQPCHCAEIGGDWPAVSCWCPRLSSIALPYCSPLLLSSQLEYDGGRQTIQEHREKGADLEVDVSWKYLNFFLEDDERLAHIGVEYGAGRMLTGEVKAELVKVLSDLVSRHQVARASVTEPVVDAFMAVRPMAAVAAGQA
ncbi:uncharacterized protein HaLaN_05508 [Haematococcus lacustris]|uniref:Uncharacterized protein n=1 Tax=Haematococcus lacustris TaxID=44745 RepID=A0A699Z455_HAELA|nr:uncharacterized protein HaLaN_05508 [Haematococcus lacustris]